MGKYKSNDIPSPTHSTSAILNDPTLFASIGQSTLILYVSGSSINKLVTFVPTTSGWMLYVNSKLQNLDVTEKLAVVTLIGGSHIFAFGGTGQGTLGSIGHSGTTGHCGRDGEFPQF
jgi:hypothetical protein